MAFDAGGLCLFGEDVADPGMKTVAARKEALPGDGLVSAFPRKRFLALDLPIFFFHPGFSRCQAPVRTATGSSANCGETR